MGLAVPSTGRPFARALPCVHSRSGHTSGGLPRSVIGSAAYPGRVQPSSDLEDLGRRSQAAARVLARSSAGDRNAALLAAADGLVARTKEVLDANLEDLARSEDAGATVIDRLRLDEGRVAGMAAGLAQVAALPDPLGRVTAGWVRSDGLEIRQVTVPLGVVGIIYENRPNVTSDAASLCVKSGNAAFLRGSSTAITSNTVISDILRDGCVDAGLPADSVLLVPDTSRESAVAFMRLRGSIDCLIPRGGPSLIDAVLDHATVPTIIDGAGNCHVYVDAAADLNDAVAIVVNGKVQRPGVCNATETVLVHAGVAAAFLPRLADALGEVVELRGDAGACRILGDRARPATDEDWDTEYLDLILTIGVVPDLRAAVDHIGRHGTGHTEAIVTADLAAAARFQHEVDAAVVNVNASTRFTDGEEFGFGAEIGISTQKLHARGPLGLAELTTRKYLVTGTGHTR
jgi:glutamate-5-semialdehyde dehydrogenase